MRGRQINLLAFLLLFTPVSILASPTPTPESLIRQYAAAWNQGDIEAFLALQSADVKKYRRMPGSSEFKLGTSGNGDVRKKYAPLFAKTPRVHVEITSLTSVGNLVVSRDEVSGFSDGHTAQELTLYEVRDGKIQNIWYLERKEVAPAETAEAQLIKDRH